MGNEIKKVVVARIGGNWRNFSKTITANVADIEDAKLKASELKEKLKPFGQNFKATYIHREDIL